MAVGDADVEELAARMFAVDRGGRWRDSQGAPDVSLRDLKIAEGLIHFLAWHEQVGGDVFANARDFSLRHKYTSEQNQLFRALLHVYLRKYTPRPKRESFL